MTYQPAMEQRLRNLCDDPDDGKPCITAADYIMAAKKFDARVEVFYLRAAIMRLTERRRT